MHFSIENPFYFFTDYRDKFCNFKNDGVYADPYDGCKGFIHCHNYHADYKPCPGGLLFNAKTGMCDWPGNVTCPIGKGPLFMEQRMQF